MWQYSIVNQFIILFLFIYYYYYYYYYYYLSPSPLSIPLALTLLYSLPISRHLSDCITSLKEVGIPVSSPLLPPTTPEFWILYGNGKRGLQKRLSQIIHTL